MLGHHCQFFSTELTLLSDDGERRKQQSEISLTLDCEKSLTTIICDIANRWKCFKANEEDFSVGKCISMPEPIVGNVNWITHRGNCELDAVRLFMFVTDFDLGKGNDG